MYPAIVSAAIMSAVSSVWMYLLVTDPLALLVTSQNFKRYPPRFHEIGLRRCE